MHVIISPLLHLLWSATTAVAVVVAFACCNNTTGNVPGFNVTVVVPGDYAPGKELWGDTLLSLALLVKSFAKIVPTMSFITSFIIVNVADGCGVGDGVAAANDPVVKIRTTTITIAARALIVVALFIYHQTIYLYIWLG